MLLCEFVLGLDEMLRWCREPVCDVAAMRCEVLRSFEMLRSFVVLRSFEMLDLFGMPRRVHCS